MQLENKKKLDAMVFGKTLEVNKIKSDNMNKKIFMKIKSWIRWFKKKFKKRNKKKLILVKEFKKIEIDRQKIENKEKLEYPKLNNKKLIE